MIRLSAVGRTVEKRIFLLDYLKACKLFFAYKLIRRGVIVMRIAVTYESGMVFQHFGHTGQFKIYDVENGKITGEQVVDTAGNGGGCCE